MMTVSFTFDDGLKAHATIAAPMLQEYGWTGAFNLCTDFLEANPPTFTEEKRRILGLTDHPDARMNWDDARRLIADGHEVYPHGCSHEDLEKCWKAGKHDLVRHEIRDSIAAFREHLGSLPRFFCCPYLGWMPEVRDIIRAEGVEMFNNWRPGFGTGEALSVRTALIKLYYEGRRHIDLMFHGIVQREGGHRPFADESEFRSILDQVAMLEQEGVLRVVPYHQAHHEPSGFNGFLDRWEWLLTKLRRVAFRLWFKDHVPAKAGDGIARRKKLLVTPDKIRMFESQDPNLSFRPLIEETADDFKHVARDRFSLGVEWQIDELLANPMRKHYQPCGDIAYEKGVPTCVQGVMLRRIYHRQEPLILLNASMFAKMPTASPTAPFGVMWRTHESRAGIDAWFGNSAVKASKDIEGAISMPCKTIDGPVSWHGRRVAYIHPLPACWTRFRSVHPRLPAIRWKEWDFPIVAYVVGLGDGMQIVRCNEIEERSFGKFWNCVLEGNDGLISSRSPENLHWMYESRLKSGRVVLLALKCGEDIRGYIILRGNDAAGKCWSVIDMIALKNSQSDLLRLMQEAVRYLRKKTPAMELTIAGFPTWVQATIGKVFKHRVLFGHNSSSFAVYNPRLESLLAIADSPKGWFCGPADGDAWL